MTTTQARSVIRDVAIVLIALIVLGLPTLLLPFGRDHGYFAYIAGVMLDGGMPYRDAWDVTSPGIYWLYALSFRICGRSEVAPHVLELVSVALSCVLAYCLVRRLGGRSAGLWASISLTVSYYSLNAFNIARLDGFVFLPILGAVALVYPWQSGRMWYLRLALAGGLLGWVLIMKYPYGIMGIALLPLLVGRGWRSSVLSIVLWLIGFATIPALFAWWFARNEALGPLIESIRYGQAYNAATRQGLSVVWSAIRGIADFVGSYPFLTLTGFGAAFMSIRKGYCHWRPCAVWLVAIMVAVVAQGKFYHYHFTQLIAPLSLLSGLWVSTVAGQIWEPTKRSLPLVALCGAMLFPNVAFLSLGYKDRVQALASVTAKSGADEAVVLRSGGLPRTEVMAAARYVAAKSAPDDTVFVWGSQPIVNFVADRRTPTRFLTCEPLVTPWAPQHWRQQFVETMRTAPPMYFLVTHGDTTPFLDLPYEAYLHQWPELMAIVQTGYVLETKIGHIDVYRLAAR